jgi:tetratricopeptide (TPR) repeat protein
MKVFIRKTCLLLLVTVSLLVLSPTLVHAEMQMNHHHFSMPLDQVISNQLDAGTYTEQRQQAEIKLTDALYETDPARAIALLEAAAAIDPTFDKPLMYACDIHRRQNNYIAAVVACQEASNRLPNYGLYEMALADVYDLAKQSVEAIATYEKAEAIYASNDTPDRAAIARTKAAKLRQLLKGLPE